MTLLLENLDSIAKCSSCCETEAGTIVSAEHLAEADAGPRLSQNQAHRKMRALAYVRHFTSALPAESVSFDFTSVGWRMLAI
jgi:hypothetical protein